MIKASSTTFEVDYVMAHNDHDLLQVLKNELGSARLSAATSSELVLAVYEIAEFTIRLARRHYAERPERLRFVVSSSEKQNAYAVWGSSGIDWIVITEGLIRLLASEAESFAEKISQSFPGVFKGDFIRRLESASPLGGGFTTALGSIVFFGALSFFIGHESGHHLNGHDGYYLTRTTFGAHAELNEDARDDEFVSADLAKHALELQADRLGAIFYCDALITMLLKLWSIQSQTVAEQATNQRAIAVVLHSSALLAAHRMKPTEVKWDAITEKATHPPSAIRILQLALAIGNKVENGFPLLDEVSRRWIRINSLEVALGLTITPKSEAGRIYKERMNRWREPLAMRATGIRKLMYDDNLIPYLREVDAQAEVIKELLRPRFSPT